VGFLEFEKDRGEVAVRLPAQLVAPLASLFADLLALIESDRPSPEQDEDPLAAMIGIEPDAGVPEDPAIARLFPDAYVGDDEAAQEFRRFTRRSMRTGKLENARTLLGTLERAEVRLSLTDDESQAWLRALNDARLVLASRLGIETEEDSDLLEEQDDDYHAFLYHLLGALQSSLVDALAAQDLSTGLWEAAEDGPEQP